MSLHTSSPPEEPITDDDSIGGPGLMDRVRQHPYTVVTVLTLLVMGIGVAAKHSSVWNRVFVGSAKALLHGRDIYRNRLYTYPPFSALFHIPFTILPPRPGRILWYLICVGSLVYLCKKSWQLAGGPKVEPKGDRPAAARPEQIAFLLGQICVLQFILNALTHLQTDLLIAAMLMAGCGAIAKGRFFRSATWIGLAAAFKATPLLFAPYLMWRRQWLAGFWLFAVAIGANLLPNAVHAAPGGGVWLARWYRLYLQPMEKPGYLPGEWKNLLNDNQGMAAAVNRWCATSWRAMPDDFQVFDRPDRPPAATIRKIFYGSCLVIFVPVVWVLWRRRREEDAGTQRRGDAEKRKDGERPSSGPSPRPRASASPRPLLPDPHMIECGMVFLLMLLLSPNSSRAHFCIMLLPAFCVARIAVRTRLGGLHLLLGLAILCSTLSIHVRLPQTLVGEQFLLWLGVVTFSALFLLLACVTALWQLSRQPAPSRLSANPAG